MSGWIKLHRQFKDHGHFHMPDRALKVWVYILLSVSHRDQPHWGIKAGEAWISYSMIAEDCGEGDTKASPQSITSSLEYLEENGYIEREIKPGVGQKITVINWHKYQADTTSETEPPEDEPLPQRKHTTSITDVHHFHDGSAPLPKGKRTTSITEDIQDVKNLKNIREGESDPLPDLSIVAEHYRRQIGEFGPMQFQDMQMWVDEWGMSPELICAAIDETKAKADNPVAGYVTSILRRWRNQNIRTLADLDKPKRSPEERARVSRLADTFRRQAERRERSESA